MADDVSQEGASPRWWLDPRLIDHRVSGVFEGGGAKGVLYTGALEGMVDGRCWFDAVAGASAGAITATLIAAGFRPSEVDEQMTKALALLHPPKPINGAFRVRDGGSVLDQDELLNWLHCMLAKSFQSQGTDPGADVTFDKLHELTGIELHVVAADLNRHQRVVFNHELTPCCQVAEAVVASAAIPFVYEWMALEIPGATPGMIVDGGIAANFPSFVFTDRSFREWAGLPALDDTSVVVGFLLDEEADAAPEDTTAYLGSAFHPEIRATPRGPRFRPGVAPGSGSKGVAAIGQLIGLLLWPFTQLFFRFFPWLLALNTGRRDLPAYNGEPSWQPALRASERWPVRLARRMSLAIDRIAIGTRPIAIFMVGLAIVSLSLGSGLYMFGWQPLVGLLDDAFHGRASVLGAIVGTVFFVVLIVLIVYAWIVLMALFVGAYFTYPTTRCIGYGLAKTFLQGAGAPPWTGAHEKDHVIKLRVPRGAGTLGFGAKVDLATARKDARHETSQRIRAIVAPPPDAALVVREPSAPGVGIEPTTP